MDTNNFNAIFLGSNAPFFLTQVSGVYSLSCAALTTGPLLTFTLNGLEFVLERESLFSYKRTSILKLKIQMPQLCIYSKRVYLEGRELLLSRFPTSVSTLSRPNDMDSRRSFSSQVLYRVRSDPAKNWVCFGSK
jgi:hypothetical protein